MVVAILASGISTLRFELLKTACPHHTLYTVFVSLIYTLPFSQGTLQTTSACFHGLTTSLGQKVNVMFNVVSD